MVGNAMIWGGYVFRERGATMKINFMKKYEKAS